MSRVTVSSMQDPDLSSTPFVPEVVELPDGGFGVVYEDGTGWHVATQFVGTRAEASEFADFLAPHLKDWWRRDPPAEDHPGAHQHIWTGYLRYSRNPEEGRFIGYVCPVCGAREALGGSASWRDDAPVRTEAFLVNWSELVPPQEHDSLWERFVDFCELASLILGVLGLLGLVAASVYWSLTA